MQCLLLVLAKVHDEGLSGLHFWCVEIEGLCFAVKTVELVLFELLALFGII